MNAKVGNSSHGGDDNVTDEEMIESYTQRNMDDISIAESCSTRKSTTGGGGDEELGGVKLEFANVENKAVGYLRLLVMSLLTLVALAVCVSVFLVSSHTEEVDYEQDFMDLSEKLVVTFETTLQQRFGIVDSFTEDITSFVQDHDGVEFPYVTIPDFERRAGRMSRLADLLCLLLLPLVETDQREKWENYAVNNQGWRGEGLALQQGIPVEEVEVDPIREEMFKMSPDGPVPEDRAGPYSPIWQTFPAVNFNSHTHLNLYGWQPLYKTSIDAVVATKRPVLPVSYDYIGTPKDDLRRKVFNMYVKSYERYSSQRYEDDPAMSFFYPVFDRPEGEANRTVKMIALGVIYWRTYFNNILPPGANGMIVILENQCGQQYTYQVDGTESKFIGHGDHHDPRFEDLMNEVHLTLDEGLYSYAYEETQDEHEQTIAHNASDAAESLQDLEADCRYKLRVYPSQEFIDSHTTNRPWVYTFTLAAVFIFTSAVFLLYDYCVERRQRVVLKSAQQSGALVHSLFPEAVRERIYQEQEAKAAAAGGEQEAVKEQSDVGGKRSSQKGCGSGENGAIANLYPCSTILFADISGFTKWSSTRSPAEVFQLLETIYGGFDKIARKRSVFKIETIGDCYVAATGLPNPQANHAVIMSKFAHDCMKKLDELVHGELIDELGNDTADLGMRFGIHSGPVTAGVLRGEKSRFQIFGDTVNTASRMESTGVRGKIQVSESTAKLLKVAGKASWVSPREEKIEAKGKGLLQTYWLYMPTSSHGGKSAEQQKERFSCSTSVESCSEGEE